MLVNVWEGTDPRPEIERFLELWGFGGTILLDETGDFARELGVRGIPTNIVVDRTGVVRVVGATRFGELDDALDRLREG